MSIGGWGQWQASHRNLRQHFSIFVWDYWIFFDEGPWHFQSFSSMYNPSILILCDSFWECMHSSVNWLCSRPGFFMTSAWLWEFGMQSIKDILSLDWAFVEGGAPFIPIKSGQWF